MNWTDENIERLRAMWKQGLACSAIGRVLGCTRNAVIGKAHRLNLEERKPNKSPAQIAGRLRDALSVRKKLDQKQDRRGQRRSSPVNAKVLLRIVEPETAASPDALNVALLNLAPSMCRWPTGYNGEHLFCGHPRESEDTCYCATHRAASVNGSLMEKVRKRERQYQQYMANADRLSRAA